MHHRRLLPLFVVVFACSDPIAAVDAGPEFDAGPMDDVGPRSDGSIGNDVGPGGDAGPGVDAGPVFDGGVDDGGPADGGPTPPTCQSTTPTAPPASLGLDPFYEKYVDFSGMPLVSSAAVDDAAFPIACTILEHMLSIRPDVLDALIANNVRVGILGRNEVTTDMPEHADLNEVFPGTDWDARARGLGATLARPLSSVGEENLLGLPEDRYRGESILVHEFAHTFFDLGVAYLGDGPSNEVRLQELYDAARAAGRYDNTYAATNAQEYWAENVQSWFNTNLEARPPDGIHNEVNTREELRAYDAELAAFIATYFEDTDWTP